MDREGIEPSGAGSEAARPTPVPAQKAMELVGLEPTGHGFEGPPGNLLAPFPGPSDRLTVKAIRGSGCASQY